MGDPEKCIYCGSKYLGGGCLFNPYGKQHIRGVEFLNRVQEQTEKCVILNYLLEKLKIKEDLVYSSPLDRFYKRVVSIISRFGEPLLETLQLQEKPTYKNLDKEQLIQVIEHKQNISKNLKNIKDIVEKANYQLPPELVEEIIVDAIMSSNGE
jgi:hypothetical protein